MVQILIDKAMAIIQYLPKTKRIDRAYADPLASVDYEDAEDTWYFDESNLDEFYTIMSREIPVTILQNNLLKNEYQKTQLSPVGLALASNNGGTGLSVNDASHDRRS